MNKEINFASDAEYVRFLVAVAAPTLMSLLESSVYMCFHPLYLFLTTSLNLIWQTIVGVLTFGRSVREKYILALGSPQVGSLISNREYEKSDRTHLFSRLHFVCNFWNLIANGWGEFLFAYRVSCSGVINLKVEICSKFSTL